MESPTVKTPDSPLNPEELPGEYLGDKKFNGQNLKDIAQNKLKHHDFAVWNPGAEEKLPAGLKATCSKCEEITIGDIKAMCQDHALTPNDKTRTIQILKKCKKRVIDEIDRRLNANRGVKWHWTDKNPGKPFPLSDNVSEWENTTETERKTAEPGIILPDILGFTKERMVKLGFKTNTEWTHLQAIWTLNSRISKCVNAIEKIKACRGIAKPTKKAMFTQPATYQGVTPSEASKQEEERQMTLKKLMSEQQNASQPKSSSLYKTKAEEKAEKAAKRAEKKAQRTQKKAEKAASAATTTRKRSEPTKTLPSRATRKRASSAESKKIPRKTQRKPVSVKRSASVRAKTRRGAAKSKGGGKKSKRY